MARRPTTRSNIPAVSQPVPLSPDSTDSGNSPQSPPSSTQTSDTQQTTPSDSDTAASPQPSAPPPQPHEILFAALRAASVKDDDIGGAVCGYVASALTTHSVASKYNIVVVHDDTSILRGDADKVYTAVTSFTEQRPLLLVLQSPGGLIPPAYFISKLCREYSNGHFAVAVPRQAKSAATLICCGADAIHMGSLSELGPIDPQIDHMPTLGLKDAVQHLAEVVKSTPESADMVASYLSKTLKVDQLGYYQRVAESATQYAERLLNKRNAIANSDSRELSRKLVYHYKDHGFVIDSDEALSLFGASIIKVNTDEYKLANSIYAAIDFSRFVVKYFQRKDVTFVGSLSSGAVIRALPQP